MYTLHKDTNNKNLLLQLRSLNALYIIAKNLESFKGVLLAAANWENFLIITIQLSMEDQKT